MSKDTNKYLKEYTYSVQRGHAECLIQLIVYLFRQTVKEICKQISSRAVATPTRSCQLVAAQGSGARRDAAQPIGTPEIRSKRCSSSVSWLKASRIRRRI